MPENSSCVITDIYWERIFLHIELKGALGKKLYLRGNGNFYSLQQKKTDKGENTSEVVLNMSAVVNRTFMENGSWRLGFFDTKKQPWAFNDKMLYPNEPKRIKASSKEMFEHNKPFRYPSKGEKRKDIMQLCVVSENVAKKLGKLDKLFRYSGTKYAYTVDFTVSSTNATHMHLYIRSYFMKVNKKWDKRQYWLEESTPKGIIKKLYLSLEKNVMNALYTFLSHLYNEKKKGILLVTEVSTTLQGNLSVIYTRIKERDIDKEINVDVSCRLAVGKSNSKKSWLNLINKIARSRMIIVDNHVPILSYLNIHKKTKVIQVWHAGAGFKGVGFMRFGKESSPFPAMSAHKKYALALAPSESLIKVFEEVFGIEKEAFFPVGMPRLDNFLEPSRTEAIIKNFYEDYPELKGKKIILFAPTYRGKSQPTAYYNYSKVDFNKFYEFCGDDHVVLLKMHPFLLEKSKKKKKPVQINAENEENERDESCLIDESTRQTEYTDLEKSNMIKTPVFASNMIPRGMPDISKFAPRILDFSCYPNINDLFCVTDILITDYSSAYYEFSIFKKPILFFVYDRLLYENVRGVYQSIKASAPGKVCDNFKQLIEALEKQDYQLEKTIAFSEAHFPFEPKGATDRLIDKVLSLLEDE